MQLKIKLHILRNRINPYSRILLTLVVLAFCNSTSKAQAVIEVTKEDTLIKDVNSNMKADPGDSLRYITKIIVSDAPATNVILDTMNFDSNLTINPNYHIGPLARPDNYASIGNVGINVLAANGLLQNDIDIDMNASGGFKATMAGATAPDTPLGTEFTTPGGGKVTVNADGLGAFTYEPSAAYAGLDSFVYRLTDGDPVTPDQNARVIITVSDVIWFVDNSAGGTGGTGTLADPFRTINDFNISSGPGNNDNIYLAQTATTYSTGIVLKSGQVLIGAGTTGTDLATEFGVTLPPNSSTLPPINNMTSPIIKPTMFNDEGITLAMNTTIKGVDVKMGSDKGIYGTGALGTVTISEVFLESNFSEEIALINASGTINIDMSGIICIVYDAINITGGSINVTFTKTSLTHSSGNAIAISGHSGTILYANDGVNSIMQTSSGNGLNVSNCTGLYIIENLTVSTGSTGTGIFITNSPAASFAFENINLTSNTGITVNGTGAGPIIVDGSSSINSANGPALNLSKASSASNNMTFTSVSSSSSTTNGINLDEFGGILTMYGGSINAAAGTAYEVGGATNASGGNATVTYAGTINNTTGSAVFIQELTGGSHTLSGNITHSGSNIGIQVSGINNGDPAAVTFSGTTKSINSGTVNAVQLLTNPNGTINFTNGGLDIDVSTGTGFNVNGGGTVNVSGSGNSITATSGKAADIQNTNIGSSDVTFQSVSAGNGSNNVINLISTGSSGGFHITGTGSNGSGGTIGNRTGADGSTTQGNGIYLNNTTDAQFSNVTLSGTFANHPILSNSITDLVLNNVRVTGTSGTNVVSDEGGIELNEITGVLSVIGGTYGGGIEDNFAVTNTTGTVTATFTNVTFTANHITTGDNGLQFITSGSGTVGNLNVNGCTFDAARSVMLFVDIGGSSGGTVIIGGTTANDFTQNQENLPGGGAIEVLASGSDNSSTTNTTISNNIILAGTETFMGDVMVVGTGFGYTGAHNVTISSNTIGTSSVNGSAVNPLDGQGDSGIVLSANGTGILNALVESNSIFDYNAAGLEVFYDTEGATSTNAGSVNLNITNNTINDFIGGEAIEFIGDDKVDACIDIKSNTLNNKTGREIVVDVFGASGGFYRVPGLVTLSEVGIQDYYTSNNTLISPSEVKVFDLAPSMITASGGCSMP